MVETNALRSLARNLTFDADLVFDAAHEIEDLRRRLSEAQAENRRLHAVELQANTPTRRGANW